MAWFDSVEVVAHLRVLGNLAISGTNLSLFDQCQVRLRQWELYPGLGGALTFHDGE